MRLPGWRGRLDAALRDLQTTPFVWGEADCGVGLAARAVQAVTGLDHAEGFRGRYDSPESAVEALKAAGYAGLPEFLMSRFMPIHPAHARWGDLALIPGQTAIGWALGVFDAQGRVLVMMPAGAGTVERERAVKAFQVG